MLQATTSVTALPELQQRSTRRWVKWLGRFAMLIGGLLVGAIVAELVFWQRDGGAFPHLNVYRADPELGVRLEPGATQKVAFGGNPITSVRINAAGYRGDDWPAPAADEIVVVGDSQVFGLGVEESETFSAKLAELLHRPVLDAGVPTYGPDEYRAVIGELLEKRHAKTVVLALNMVNDLFEASHPNRTRHAVWDGWAVRKESAPESVSSFPGRDWLYRRSHLFFALRTWWNKRDPIEERGFASEGTWQDLAASGRDVKRERDARAEQTQQLAAKHDADRRKLQQDLREADAQIDSQLYSVLAEDAYPNAAAISAGAANPGDIISDGQGEEARGLVVTADMIRHGVEVRAALRKKLAAWAQGRRSRDAKQLQAALDTRTKALDELSEIDVQKIQAALDPPLAAYVRDVQQLCAAHGARLVVVILPIDVQVSADEWKKYDAKPIDMAPTRILNEELAAASTALGISTLDASDSLAKAEPGAFLDHDIHMTPKGHAALAAALAKVIAEPPPVPPSTRARPAMPPPALWREAPEVIVTGSTSAGCETKMVREWLRVMCGRTTDGDEPTKVAIEHDDGGSALALAMPHQTSLVATVVEGHEVTALFTWTDHTRRLHISWPAGAAKATLAFDAPVKIAGHKAAFDVQNLYYQPERYDDKAQSFASPVEQALCKCWDKTFNVQNEYTKGTYACSGAYGTAEAACTTRYKDDCARMIECAWHDPASPAK